jgi:hypothetical protein
MCPTCYLPATLLMKKNRVNLAFQVPLSLFFDIIFRIRRSQCAGLVPAIIRDVDRTPLRLHHQQLIRMVVFSKISLVSEFLS